MHYVVIGAGPTGVIAAETLRKTDPSSSVTVVGDEPEPPYSRMAIPYLLTEKIDEDGTYLRKDADYFEGKRIEVLRDAVVRVDKDARSLDLRSGGHLTYDELLVATGSTPIRPPVPGMESRGVVTCWTLEDARQIMAMTKPDAKVVLIGAGFIGCIILESLAMRRVDLTVVEMGDRMVPRMMNETAGGMIKRWCESKDVRVHTSTSVTEVRESGTSAGPRSTSPAAPPASASGASGGIMAFFRKLLGGEGEASAAASSAPTTQGAAQTTPGVGHGLVVVLSDGTTMEADLVISAAGVQPNADFLKGTGIEIDAGIKVDRHFRTSVDHIYAAGDVAQGRDFSTGDYQVHAIQPTASEHGRIAALNMAGHPTEYAGSLNMNVLDTVGLISSSFGQWMGVDGGDSAVLADAKAFKYLDLQFDGDVLVGATSLGWTQHVGVLRGLIQGRTHLGDWKQRLMADPTRIMEAYLERNLSYQ